MRVEIVEMSIEDYDQVVALWRATDGIGLDDDCDTRECTEAYLVRNANLSFIARDGSDVVGAVLCGHDGRRGFLHHLAVATSHRRQGIAKALVERCISALGTAGINKCNIMVFDDNSDGLGFWITDGWDKRSDLVLLQKWVREPKCDGGRSC